MNTSLLCFVNGISAGRLCPGGGLDGLVRSGHELSEG